MNDVSAVDTQTAILREPETALLVNHAFARVTHAIFAIFVVVAGSEQQSPCLLVRTPIRHFSPFLRQTPLLRFTKSTVFGTPKFWYPPLRFGSSHRIPKPLFFFSFLAHTALLGFFLPRDKTFPEVPVTKNSGLSTSSIQKPAEVADLPRGLPLYLGCLTSFEAPHRKSLPLGCESGHLIKNEDGPKSENGKKLAEKWKMAYGPKWKKWPRNGPKIGFGVVLFFLGGGGGGSISGPISGRGPFSFFRANLFPFSDFGPFLTNPGTAPVTILAVHSDHGLSFAGEEARTMVRVSFSLQIYNTFEFWRFKFSVVLSFGLSFLILWGLGVVPTPSTDMKRLRK